MANDFSTLALRRFLRDLGYAVAEAPNGVAALETQAHAVGLPEHARRDRSRAVAQLEQLLGYIARAESSSARTELIVMSNVKSGRVSVDGNVLALMTPGVAIAQVPADVWRTVAAEPSNCNSASSSCPQANRAKALAKPTAPASTPPNSRATSSKVP